MQPNKLVTNDRGLYDGRRPGSDPGHHIERGRVSQPADFGIPVVARQTAIGIILVVALLAFEVFNFDTTRFALQNLLGSIDFINVGWATILAIAFCAIDFAGLAHLFTPERGAAEPKEVWYLMGAWLMGATMNAMMTWWAVSVTLLSHDLGNEILSREQLLQTVPVFVAVLVWLTRILFIGAFTVAGDHLFKAQPAQRPEVAWPDAAKSQVRMRPGQSRLPVGVNRPTRTLPHTSDEVPNFLQQRPAQSVLEEVDTVELGRPAMPARQSNERTRQRPPVPGPMNRPVSVGMQAQSRNRR